MGAMDRKSKDDEFKARALRAAKERRAIEAARRVVGFYRANREDVSMQSLEDYIDSLDTLEQAVTVLDAP